MKRILLTIVLAAGILAGCGGGHPVAYRPIAYGENNQCYYVNNPAEVVALQAQGLCQPGWAPTLMPVYWHQRYYPYYSSPAYFNVYVPAANRSSYATSERSWGANNKSAIATETKTATYQGSNGKTVPASKIGAAKYGGGGRFGPTGTKFGGGSGRAGGSTDPATPSKPVTAPPKAGTPSKAVPSKPASPAPKSSPGVRSNPPPRSSGGSRSYGGGSGRSSGGGYSGGGSRSYGGGGGRR